MKRIILPLLLAFSPTAFAVSAGKPEIAKIDGLYVPQGFDDNDIVEVVISGTFGDSCHQVGETIVKIDAAKKLVSLTPISYKEAGKLCMQMLSPYSHVVRIGHMDEGSYTFRVSSDAKIEKTLKVKRAMVEQSDDFLYAPVDFAEVIPGPPGASVLVLKGRYPLMKTGCMKTQDVEMSFENGDTLVVLPKAIVTQDVSGGCDADYEQRFRVPFDLMGEILIHVRALNGQSYNRVEKVN
jgi:hypothetical protein